MKALVSVEPEVEAGLAIIVSRYPANGFADVLELMSQVIDAIRRCVRGQAVDDWDPESVQAIRDFISSRDRALVADNNHLYVVAERGRCGSAILFTKAGLYGE